MSNGQSASPLLHATTTDQERDLEILGIKVRSIFDCSVVIASLSGTNNKLTLTKLALVSDKIKAGFLLLLYPNGTTANLEISRFLTKKILLRGKDVHLSQGIEDIRHLNIII